MKANVIVCVIFGASVGSFLASCSEQEKLNGPRNERPVPEFTAPELVRPGRPAQFDATASADPDGTIDSARWDFGDGTTATSLVATKTYQSAGNFTVTLSVCDNRRAWASISKTIVVKPNQPPVARFTHTEQTYYDWWITFDAKPSTDSDGKVTKASWLFGDQSTSTEFSVTKRFRRVGALPVRLIVYDDEGGADTVSKTLDIRLRGELSECASWLGSYTVGRRWEPRNGPTPLYTKFSSNFPPVDPNWVSPARNSAVNAMAEWHWWSGANIEFYYNTQIQAGVGVDLDDRNIICARNIDGPDGILGVAHSWYYTSSGYLAEVDVAVDNSEVWGAGGYDLQAVLTHEFGHAWGLGHVNNAADNLETMYFAYHSEMKTLFCGDSRGVKSLYGIKSAPASGEEPEAFRVGAWGGGNDTLCIPEPPVVLVGNE